MPLILRHLAAAVLPLSATAAGILAVGIAVQLPRAPSPVAALPPVVSPLEPVPGVVAQLPPGTRRAPALVIVQRSVSPTTPSAGYRRFLIRRVDGTDPRRRVRDADAGKPAAVASAHHPRAVPGGGGSAADAAGGTGAGDRRRPPRPRPGTTAGTGEARARPPVAGSPRSPASRRCRRRRPTRERRAPTSEPSMLPGRPTRPRSSRRPTGLRRPTRFRRTTLRRTGRRTSLRTTRLRRTRLPESAQADRLRRTGSEGQEPERQRSQGQGSEGQEPEEQGAEGCREGPARRGERPAGSTGAIRERRRDSDGTTGDGTEGTHARRRGARRPGARRPRRPRSRRQGQGREGEARSVIRSQHRQLERVGALRGRLIASILIASLLPFFAAWWIANAYVADQARTNADVRLSFSARSAAREATALLSQTRARALELAKNGKLQRAARRRDRPALERLLGPGEAVYLPARRRGATTVPAVWVGQRIEGAPAVRVGVTAAGRRLATVSVSAPVGQALLDRVKRTALAVTGDELALTRGGIVVAGPAALRGARLGTDGRLQSGGDAFRAQSVVLPGYDPPVRIVAAADGSVAGDDSGALRQTADDRRARLAARDRPLCGGPREAAAAEPQSRRFGCGAGDARSAHGHRQPARLRACARGRARTVGPAWPSVRARDRRPRRLQARQRSSRAWGGGRGARDAGRAAPGLGAFGGHGCPARR